ncbi:dihydrolipoyl dehydrogenase [Geothermobacter hydrogeniphilus]|uniref:Dihydrolipoyl dehydrogenase n=1 Tax=Geothermobacter hydrogeniphilus TaxID=1969733 RepID=A0A1X0XWA6_9BACT|nr:dihydrolipoyl dehydrogenase [Geothermobacter hydrogeniphilus]
MHEQKFDLIVVGGGPGGYVAAIRGSQLGLKTALVEAEHLGGICLNWGCIPTKALLRSAEAFRTLKNARRYGLKAADISVDLNEVVKRSRRIASRLQKGVGFLLKKNAVTLIEGTGTIAAPGLLQVEKEGQSRELRGRHIILATGARPLQPGGLESDGQQVWTYKEAMTPDQIPQRLLVIGAGAIGLEFASFYNDLGTEVTVVEALSQILPAGDTEISTLLTRELQRKGIAIRTDCRVQTIDRQPDAVTVGINSQGETEQFSFDRVLLAIGVVGNVENLGLENTKVQVERGVIRVNQWLQTDEPGIYAIGDVTGAPCLAHKASHEGVICVEKIAGVKTVRPLKREQIPYCTYSHPQVANVGLTEAQARERGPVRVGKFPFTANGKAIALGETEGLIKTVFDADSGRLLGAHMIGAEVTEMLQGFGIALNLEAGEQELSHTIFAHPTLSEMMHESVLAAFEKAIHI